MTSRFAQQSVEDFGDSAPKSSQRLSASEAWSSVKKASQNRWVYLGVFVAALVALGTWNVQITLTERTLSDQEAALAGTTNVALPDPAVVAPDIEAAQQRLNDTQDAFLAGFSDPQISRLLIDLGAEHSVTVNFTDIEPESFMEVEGRTFPAKLVAMSADGSIDDLVSYTTALENGAIEGLEIQSTRIASRTEEDFTAQINVAVYRQLLDRDEE